MSQVGMRWYSSLRSLRHSLMILEKTLILQLPEFRQPFTSSSLIFCSCVLPRGVSTRYDLVPEEPAWAGMSSGVTLSLSEVSSHGPIQEALGWTSQFSKKRRGRRGYVGGGNADR